MSDELAEAKRCKAYDFYYSNTARATIEELIRLRAELAEAQAEIARLTEQLRLTNIDQFNAEAANSDIVEAATALVEAWKRGTRQDIAQRVGRLVAAVEEGSKT